jgi:glycosyltransferase involved in cell wall biosynthesis
MRIAQLAPPVETVPPARYGGTERVIATLTEELVRRGHEVTLFASADSHTSARLIPTCEQAVWHRDPPLRDPAPAWSRAVGTLMRHVDEFDVIHSHLDHFGFPLARASAVPVVTTLHGRLDLPEVKEALAEFNDVPLVSISDSQRRPVDWANFVATVQHGMPLDGLTFKPRPGDYLAFLGRVSADKGLDIAIRVARQVDMPLKVAARMPLPTTQNVDARRDAEYWQTVIRPMLGTDVELIGEVGGDEKDALLGNAAALLFPIRWPEPFGLVMIEALACGTPVLAMRQGSVPEVIQDGLTGYVVDTEEELVESVRRLWAIDRAACRHDVETRFSPSAMAEAYLRVYEQLIAESASRDILDLKPLDRAANDRGYRGSASTVWSTSASTAKRWLEA